MNRWHLACALVPMQCGVAMVALLAPPPAASMAASGARAASPNDTEQLSEAGRRFVGVIVAGNTAELAADADGVVAAVFVHNGLRVKAGDKLSNGYSVVRVDELSLTLADADGVTQTIRLP